MSHEPKDAPGSLAADTIPDELYRGREAVTGEPAPRGAARPSERYERLDLIDGGGATKVWLCRDRRIGRTVALRTLAAEGSAERAIRLRFIREAQVQGQLDHPAITPVYDLHVEQRPGRPDEVHFTTQRARGQSLAQIIDQLRDDPAAEQYPRRRLLTAFSSVCLAVDYVHGRGVLHHNLKPANITLGEFGEVYIMEWGNAEVLEAGDAPEVGDEGSHISPGQAAADVHALGATLFELLALRPLPARDAGEGAVDARPSAAAPELDIPPELDEICVKATTATPGERLPDARALHDLVERYLDGERDEALRKDLAVSCVEAAARDMERLRRDPRASLEQRRDAVRQVGQALALDADNDRALEVLVDALTEPIVEVPPEVEREVERSDQALYTWSGRAASVAYLTLWPFLPLLLWAGVRDAVPVATLFVLITVSNLMALWTGFARRASMNMVFATMLVSTLCMASTRAMFGPLLVMPALLVVNTSCYALILDGWRRTVSITFSCLLICVVVALDLLELPASNYLFTDGGLTIMPRVINLEQTPTVAVLYLAGVSMTLMMSVYVSSVRRRALKAERALNMSTWQIRQLMMRPEEVPVNRQMDGISKVASIERSA